MPLRGFSPGGRFALALLPPNGWRGTTLQRVARMHAGDDRPVSLSGRWRLVTDFVVGQRVRVRRATGRDDIVEGDVGWVLGYAPFTLRVRFLPRVTLTIPPTMVEVIRDASSADQPPA